MAKLSHHESIVLALILKWQPVTAYFVRKALGQRLASDASDSPGSAYPVINRLRRAGLVRAEEMGDRRGTEHLWCTQSGEAAVREWLVRLDDRDMLPEDPWRTRIAFMDMLPQAELRDWLFALREALKNTLAELEDQQQAAISLETELELLHARMITSARLSWASEAVLAIDSARVRAAS
jgi:DNA-binding PadR family transcriptional regulator